MAKRVTKGNLWGFIQSRPYASVADIRRMFLMEVDGAAPIPTSEGTCYIGLPSEAAELIAQLTREGRIALDLNPNVKARVVQGVYPVRMPALRTASGDGADGERKRKRRRRRKPGDDLWASSGETGERAQDGAAAPIAAELILE